MKMFRDLNKEDLVPGIQEVLQEEETSTSDPEYTLPVNAIPDEGEIVIKKENIKSSELTYPNNETDTDMSEYER